MKISSKNFVQKKSKKETGGKSKSLYYAGLTAANLSPKTIDIVHDGVFISGSNKNIVGLGKHGFEVTVTVGKKGSIDLDKKSNEFSGTVVLKRDRVKVFINKDKISSVDPRYTEIVQILTNKKYIEPATGIPDPGDPPPPRRKKK